jgi:alkanesulfonate monooxygenase SsuD/methylene tetrahydromethanopterin reductase-like flavin-dependent oxidoreductase (luciferase family)
MDVGVGLWCMRSTSDRPASPAGLYRELVDDALLADELGLHSLWLSEHHGWYDGWCPSLLVAAGAVLGATSDLCVGTGVFLLPLHDPARVAAAGHALHQLGPGRTELGVGLGYRDAEFDAVGISRTQRGRLADAALDLLAGEWADGGPRIWIGGISEPAIHRAADRGLSLFLPSSMRPDRLRELIERAREAAAARGTTIERIGVLKDAWITDGSAARERSMRAAIGRHVREYGGAWWLLQGRLGFDVPELLDRQVRRSEDAALVGPPDAIAQELRALDEIGVDLVVLQVANDFTRGGERENMTRIATEIVPALA